MRPRIVCFSAMMFSFGDGAHLRGLVWCACARVVSEMGLARLVGGLHVAQAGRRVSVCGGEACHDAECASPEWRHPWRSGSSEASGLASTVRTSSSFPNPWHVILLDEWRTDQDTPSWSAVSL